MPGVARAVQPGRAVHTKYPFSQAITMVDVQKVNIVEVSDVAVTLGQKVMASSFPVVLASDHSNIPVNIANDDVGLATAAKQDTIITNTATVATAVGGVIGFNGIAGPAGAYSIGGTETGGTFREIRVDSSGHPQIDVLTLPDVTQATASNLKNEPDGNKAHDDTDTGNPIKIGGKASVPYPSAVASGDRTDAWFDTEGRLHVDHSKVTTWENPSPSSAGWQTGITPSSGKAIVIKFVHMTNDGSGNTYAAVRFQSTAQPMFQGVLHANGGSRMANLIGCNWKGSVDEVVQVWGNATHQIRYSIGYIEV